jgi:hypothetical protein
MLLVFLILLLHPPPSLAHRTTLFTANEDLEMRHCDLPVMHEG